MARTSTPTTYLLTACLACLTSASASAQASSPIDPYATVEAEDADLQVGTRTVRSGEAVGFIKDGDYIVFEEVAFGRGPLTGEVTGSSARSGGTIEFRVDAVDGPLVAEAAITPTGGWISDAMYKEGIVYLEHTRPAGEPMHIDGLLYTNNGIFTLVDNDSSR